MFINMDRLWIDNLKIKNDNFLKYIGIYIITLICNTINWLWNTELVKYINSNWKNLYKFRRIFAFEGNGKGILNLFNILFILHKNMERKMKIYVLLLIGVNSHIVTMFSGLFLFFYR